MNAVTTHAARVSAITWQIAVEPSSTHCHHVLPLTRAEVSSEPTTELPRNADRVIREELIDLVMLGRPALANPHWPIWAARELGHPSPFSSVQQDWRWWLENFRGHAPSIGWPEVREGSASPAAHDMASSRTQGAASA